jgi:hypothetical protein
VLMADFLTVITRDVDPEFMNHQIEKKRQYRKLI